MSSSEIGASETDENDGTRSLQANLVTFNIRWPSDDDGPNQWKFRQQSLIDVIRELNPDVMGVQEAFASQLKELSEAFPGLRFVGVGRDDGKENGEFAALFYRADRYDCLASGTFWLSDTPEVAGSNTWDAACNRVCTWACLEDRETKLNLLVYNAHLDHESIVAREKSMRLIEKRIRRCQEEFADAAIVVMGDFNAFPESAPVRFWLGDAVELAGESAQSSIALRNTLQEDPAGEQATFHGWEGRTKGKQIDYILVTDHFEVEEAAIVRARSGDQYPSDHYPVMARVKLNPP